MDSMNFRAALAVNNIELLLQGSMLHPDGPKMILDKMDELRASGFYARFPAPEMEQELKGGNYG